MDQVVLDAEGEVAADRARRRLGAVGQAHQAAAHGDRLAPFPRRREQRDVAGAFAPRRSVDRKHVAAKVLQVAGRRRPVGLRLDGSAQRN